MTREKMVRVKRDNPCPICGKPDWCLIAEDGSACICARVAEGGKKAKEAGWLHILTDKPLPNPKRITRTPVKVEPPKDFKALAKQYYDALPDKLAIATGLGVSIASLDRLRVGWCSEKKAYTFPMRSGQNKIIGIRTRTKGGKFAIPGSKNGLFIPVGTKFESDDILFICEGASDVAALWDLGFSVIGRASCSTGFEYIKQAIEKYNRRVVVFSDKDEDKTRPDGKEYNPGFDGAVQLAKDLKPHVKWCKIIKPPRHKDARAWYQDGCTKEMVELLVKNARFIQ